jgi:ribulose-phosphate 3-epimerase
MCAISASLICADSLRIEEQLQQLISGGVDQIHFDVMDGRFVPRFGLYPEVLSALRSITSIPVDVHMMVVDPEPYIEAFAQAGATYIAPHIEPLLHPHRVLQHIRNAGVKSGVALNISTPLSVLDYLLDEIDMIMIMAINPGIVGHKLIPQAIEKIRALKKNLKEKNKDGIIIGVDGGVTPDSAPEMKSAGADFLVGGSKTVFISDRSLAENISAFKKVLS